MNPPKSPPARKHDPILCRYRHRAAFPHGKNRRFSAIARVALRKLIQLNQAGTLQDMAVPPGNRLEALKGNLAGFHSIRVDDQWRIVFQWTVSGAEQVAIVDYHR